MFARMIIVMLSLGLTFLYIIYIKRQINKEHYRQKKYLQFKTSYNPVEIRFKSRKCTIKVFTPSESRWINEKGKLSKYQGEKPWQVILGPKDGLIFNNSGNYLKVVNGGIVVLPSKGNNEFEFREHSQNRFKLLHKGKYLCLIHTDKWRLELLDSWNNTLFELFIP